MSPLTRNWHAVLDLSPGTNPILEVTGEILVSPSSVDPIIRVSSLQGVLAQDLYLELLAEGVCSAEGHGCEYREIKFQIAANQEQFSHVSIFLDGEALTTMRVEEII